VLGDRPPGVKYLSQLKQVLCSVASLDAEISWRKLAECDGIGTTGGNGNGADRSQLVIQLVMRQLADVSGFNFSVGRTDISHMGNPGGSLNHHPMILYWEDGDDDDGRKMLSSYWQEDGLPIQGTTFFPVGLRF